MIMLDDASLFQPTYTAYCIGEQLKQYSQNQSPKQSINQKQESVVMNVEYGNVDFGNTPFATKQIIKLTWIIYISTPSNTV